MAQAVAALTMVGGWVGGDHGEGRTRGDNHGSKDLRKELATTKHRRQVPAPLPHSVFRALRIGLSRIAFWGKVQLTLFYP